jgi:hypothetical protein
VSRAFAYPGRSSPDTLAKLVYEITVPLLHMEHQCLSAVPLVEQLASATVPHVTHTNATLPCWLSAAKPADAKNAAEQRGGQKTGY